MTCDICKGKIEVDEPKTMDHFVGEIYHTECFFLQNGITQDIPKETIDLGLRQIDRIERKLDLLIKK
jgi:hypothetical protein